MQEVVWTKRPFVISYLIDAALGVIIITSLWQGGKFVGRLETALESLENLSSRVTALEQHPFTNNASAKIQVLENRIAAHELVVRDLKVDLVQRLDRIENKLDSRLPAKVSPRPE